MNFIPLKDIKKVLDATDNELNEKLQLFLNSWDANSLKKIQTELKNDKLTLKEVKYQFESLQEDSTLVFHQWITQSKNLEALLIGGKIETNDFRELWIKEHFLFPKFSQFISPFITQILFTLINASSNQVNGSYASYLVLLTSNDQGLIQGRIQNKFDEEWKLLEKALIEVKDEKKLITLLSSYFSDYKIETLNSFTKTYYAAKVQLIDRGISQFNHPKSSYRIAYWIINQLDKLQLNPEHKNHIKEVQNSIRTGDGKYMKPQGLMKRTYWTKKTLQRGVILLGVLALAYWVYGLLPNLDSHETEAMASSFEQFSISERRHLDSLIRTMEVKEIKEEEFKNDNAYLHITPVAIPIVDREKYKNSKVDNYVKACFKALDLVEQGKVDTCVPYTPEYLGKITFPEFKSTEASKGSQNMYFRNASPDQVLFILFDDKPDGRVFVKLLNQSEELQVGVEVGQKVLILPGTNLGRFAPDPDVKDPPKSIYRHHFCYTDSYFEENLKAAYQIKKGVNSQSKVLINRSSQGVFYLLDLDQVLEQ